MPVKTSCVMAIRAIGRAVNHRVRLVLCSSRTVTQSISVGVVSLSPTHGMTAIRAALSFAPNHFLSRKILRPMTPSLAILAMVITDEPPLSSQRTRGEGSRLFASS
jgi:hypothetical protein